MKAQKKHKIELAFGDGNKLSEKEKREMDQAVAKQRALRKSKKAA